MLDRLGGRLKVRGGHLGKRSAVAGLSVRIGKRSLRTRLMC